MYIEVSGKKKGERAVLLTPSLAGSPQTRCLTFWYHMYGNTVGKLEVLVSDLHYLLDCIHTQSPA